MTAHPGLQAPSNTDAPAALPATRGRPTGMGTARAASDSPLPGGDVVVGAVDGDVEEDVGVVDGGGGAVGALAVELLTSTGALVAPNIASTG